MATSAKDCVLLMHSGGGGGHVRQKSQSLPEYAKRDPSRNFAFRNGSAEGSSSQSTKQSGGGRRFRIFCGPKPRSRQQNHSDASDGSSSLSSPSSSLKGMNGCERLTQSSQDLRAEEQQQQQQSRKNGGVLQRFDLFSSCRRASSLRQSLDNLVRRGRKDALKARVEAKREKQCADSSSEDEAQWDRLKRYYSDESLHCPRGQEGVTSREKRLLEARTERYYKRKTRDDSENRDHHSKPASPSGRIDVLSCRLPIALTPPRAPTPPPRALKTATQRPQSYAFENYHPNLSTNSAAAPPMSFVTTASVLYRHQSSQSREREADPSNGPADSAAPSFEEVTGGRGNSPALRIFNHRPDACAARPPPSPGPPRAPSEVSTALPRVRPGPRPLSLVLERSDSTGSSQSSEKQVVLVPPAPPARRHFWQLPDRKPCAADNLEDAIHELENIYEILKADDNVVEGEHPTSAIDVPDAEPDTVLDDLAFRNIRDANLQKVLEPQPPFGIPLGPVSQASPNDYLHAQAKDLSRPKMRRRFLPDVVQDDLAYRTLRRDKGSRPYLRPNFDELDSIVDEDLRRVHVERRRLRAVRSLSANIGHLLEKRQVAVPVHGGTASNVVQDDRGRSGGGPDLDASPPRDIWQVRVTLGDPVQLEERPATSGHLLKPIPIKAVGRPIDEGQLDELLSSLVVDGAVATGAMSVRLPLSGLRPSGVKCHEKDDKLGNKVVAVANRESPPPLASWCFGPSVGTVRDKAQMFCARTRNSVVASNSVASRSSREKISSTSVCDSAVRLSKPFVTRMPSNSATEGKHVDDVGTGGERPSDRMARYKEERRRQLASQFGVWSSSETEEVSRRQKATTSDGKKPADNRALESLGLSADGRSFVKTSTATSADEVVRTNRASRLRTLANGTSSQPSCASTEFSSSGSFRSRMASGVGQSVLVPGQSALEQTATMVTSSEAPSSHCATPVFNLQTESENGDGTTDVRHKIKDKSSKRKSSLNRIGAVDSPPPSHKDSADVLSRWSGRRPRHFQATSPVAGVSTEAFKSVGIVRTAQQSLHAGTASVEGDQPVDTIEPRLERDSPLRWSGRAAALRRPEIPEIFRCRGNTTEGSKPSKDQDVEVKDICQPCLGKNNINQAPGNDASGVLTSAVTKKEQSSEAASVPPCASGGMGPRQSKDWPVSCETLKTEALETAGVFYSQVSVSTKVCTEESSSIKRTGSQYVPDGNWQLGESSSWRSSSAVLVEEAPFPNRSRGKDLAGVLVREEEVPVEGDLDAQRARSLPPTSRKNVTPRRASGSDCGDCIDDDLVAPASILKKRSLDEGEHRTRSILKTKDEVRTVDWRPPPVPPSILKRGSVDEGVRCASPDKFSILKKWGSSEGDAEHRCSSPEVLSSILRRRGSEEPEETLHSILRRKSVASEDGGDVVASAAAAMVSRSPEPHSILKKQSSVDAQETSLLQDPRPILKKKCSVDECEPKPILKKKSSTEDDLEDWPKPILKSRRRSALDDEPLDAPPIAEDQSGTFFMVSSSPTLPRCRLSTDQGPVKVRPSTSSEDEFVSLPPSPLVWKTFDEEHAPAALESSTKECPDSLPASVIPEWCGPGVPDIDADDSTAAVPAKVVDLRSTRRRDTDPGRFRTQPVTFVEPHSVNEVEPFRRAGSFRESLRRFSGGITSSVEDGRRWSFSSQTNSLPSSTLVGTEALSSEDDVVHLSVAAKASLFMQKQNELRQHHSSCSQSRSSVRRQLQRSQTQPITTEEVQEAAKMADRDGKVKESSESEEDPSKLSLAERVRLFNQKMVDERLPSRKLNNGSGAPRKRTVVSTRFCTQPVTTDEVEKASRLSSDVTTLPQDEDVGEKAAEAFSLTSSATVACLVEGASRGIDVRKEQLLQSLAKVGESNCRKVLQEKLVGNLKSKSCSEVGVTHPPSSSSSSSTSTSEDEDESDGVTIDVRTKSEPSAMKTGITDDDSASSSHSTGCGQENLRRGVITNDAVLRRRNASLRKMEERKGTLQLQHSQSLIFTQSASCAVSKTKLSSAMDSTEVVGGSIKERLAALQKSQDEDWRRRLERLKTVDDVDGDEDNSQAIANESVDDNCKISSRVSLLESSQQEWRKRVEEKDATKFTVAGKLHQAGKGDHALTPPPPLPDLDRKRRVPKPVRFQSKTANIAEVAKSLPTPHQLRVSSIARSKSMPMPRDTGSSDEEQTAAKVSVPKLVDEGFSSFFRSADLDDLHLQKVEVQEEVFDQIASESTQLVVKKRTVQMAKRRIFTKNPIRVLARRSDLQEEYVEVKSGVAEQELRRIKVEQLAKHSDLATSALAGLASTEDFTTVNLRRNSSMSSLPFPPYKELMLLQVKGRRHVQTRIVAPTVASLNKGDSFVLVTPTEVFNWHGEFSNVIERAKSAEVASVILTRKDLGCKGAADVITFDEEKHTGSRGKRRDFFQHLGGEDTVLEATSSEEDEAYEGGIISTNKVYTIGEDELVPHEQYWGCQPRVEMLDAGTVLVFDFGSEMYVWQGKLATADLRKRATRLARELWEVGYDYTDCDISPLNPLRQLLLLSSGKQRPPWALFAKVNQHMETVLFREKFLDWPDMERVIKVRRQDSESRSEGSVDLQPCDAQLMFDTRPSEPDVVLEGSHLGRGTCYWDEEEKRHLDVTTLAIKVWHVQEYTSNILPLESWGQFHSGDTYVIRWQYRVTVAGRSLAGEVSKHSYLGRERCAYFFWQGRDSTINEKGASALMTVELDEERGPHVRVVQGSEPPCFLNLFNGGMIVYRGKRGTDSAIEADWRMFVVRGDFENEVHLVEIECEVGFLRSRGLYVVVGPEAGIVHLWIGSKSQPHFVEAARAAVAVLVHRRPTEIGFQGEVVLHEEKEGGESEEFWEAIGGRPDVSSLATEDVAADFTPRLFHMTSVSGVFSATELSCSFFSKDRVCAFPFLQADLYKAEQPALFLLDDGRTVYVWQGWWPEGADDNDNTATGSAHLRFNVERRLAMETALDYCRVKSSDNPVPAFVVYAGLEPLAFQMLFPAWDAVEEVAKLNRKDGTKDGERKPVSDVVQQLKRTRYSYEELQNRPLPEGVDPAILESYLCRKEFEDVLKVSKKEFYALPVWKQTNMKKAAGLYF